MDCIEVTNMDVKGWIKKLMVGKAKPAAPRLPDLAAEAADWKRRFPNANVRNLDAEEELARRREINARGAALRAERGAALDALFGRPRWIQPRRDWIPRPSADGRRTWPRRGW